MTERAAHLVDAVLPRVPVRQWVLTVPYRLRYQMVWKGMYCSPSNGRAKMPLDPPAEVATGQRPR
jgi:hypothetical protein